MVDELSPMIAENCISEELDAVLAQLTTDQIRYVVARQECSTDREAARLVKISESTVYRWPDVVKRAVRLMATDGIVVARHVLRRNLAKAALVKTAGLDSDDERVRQAAATEILDRHMGTAVQKQEVSGPEGAPLSLIVNIAKREDGDAAKD